MTVRVSPIVNIFEKDLSYIPQAVQDIPYMYVSLFQKGKAFIPKVFNIYDDVINEFGSPSSEYKSGYAIKSRMQNGGNVAVVRILGQSGYIASDAYALTSGTTILGYVRSSMILESATGGSISSFTLNVNSGTTATFNNLSLVKTDTSNYISNIIYTVANNQSTSANNFTLKNAGVTGGLYIEKLYQYKIDTMSASSALGLVAMPSASSYATSYSNSNTTTIVSKPVGNNIYDLFQINTISDGKESTKYKVGIDNINDTTGKFNLFVRDFNDTDKSSVVLETWTDLQMSTTADRYIGKVIGDSILTVDSNGNVSEDGNYPNKSKYIYLTNIATVLPTGVTIVPGGFKGYVGKVSGSLSEPTLPLKRNQYNSNSQVDKKVHFGVDFSKSNIANYLAIKPVGMTNNTTTADKGFLLSTNIEATSLSSEYYGVSKYNYESSSYTALTYDASSSASYNALDNFICAVAGGFDGFDEELSTENKLKFDVQLSGGAFVSTSTVVDSIGYDDFKLAIDTIQSPDNVDFKLLFTPSVYQAEAIAYALDMVESRADAFYVPDLVSATGSQDTVISLTDNYDTSYAGVFYPGTKQKDINTGKYEWIDTSIMMSEIFSYNDKVAQPWYVAAGMNRGRVKNAYIAYKKLTKTDRDSLYSNRVNPVATFMSQGEQQIVIWGNRTLQKTDSALSDINIRRLLIEGRKFVTSVALKLMFEPIDQDLFDKFKKAVNPYFDTVKTLKGLTAYRVVMDNTTTTSDDIDKDQVNGYIQIKPTKSAEVINIGFIVTRQGAIFEEGL